MKTPVKTDTKDEVVKRDEPRYDPIQERAPDREAAKQADPRDDIKKQIADHEKWMNDHSDDARGVQERLQQIAVLQAKLAEMDQPKHETRVRQVQTV